MVDPMLSDLPNVVRIVSIVEAQQTSLADVECELPFALKVPRVIACDSRQLRRQEPRCRSLRWERDGRGG